MTGTKILIVDDAVFVREQLKDIFKNAGFEVIGEAKTGEEAVEEFHKLKPDIVTMDVVMPGMGGIEAVKRIREMDPDARIIMVTAMGQHQLVVEAICAGAVEFIVKPFEEETVLTAVKKAIA